MPRVFWIVLSAMFATWLAMNLWSAPMIEEMSGGLRLLDMRLTGYSFAEARDFVTATGEEGVALYLGPQLWLDRMFPPLLGAVLFFCYRSLFPGRAGLVVGALSLTFVLVDYLENLALLTILRAGPNSMTPEMVAMANQWTTTKWSLAVVGFLALAFGVALRLTIKFRRLAEKG